MNKNEMWCYCQKKKFNQKKYSCNEFHISKKVRDACNFSKTLFSSSGNIIFADIKQVRIFTEKLNSYLDATGKMNERVSNGSVNAMGLIDEVFHYMCALYRKDVRHNAFSSALEMLDKTFGKNKIDELLLSFIEEFPPVELYRKKKFLDAGREYLSKKKIDIVTNIPRQNREQVFEEMFLLYLANENPAFKKFSILFNDKKLAKNPLYKKVWKETKKHFALLPPFGPFNHDLINLLKEPVVFAPDNLRQQLEYIIKHWKHLLGGILHLLLSAIDTIKEEEKAAWHGDGDVLTLPYSYENLMNEYERFSSDSDWMPKVVLIAKTVLVWLHQLSQKYNRFIHHLDEIPDEELDLLRDRGFTGLWLIGLWKRSYASRRIKQINGNAEAVSSAYSLYDYEIADEIGGWDALFNLRNRLISRGIRLASDMVPNHTGMDSKWIVEKPNLFIQRQDCPFPQYSFTGENLSLDERVGVYLEDHYYDKTDCAVIFKRVDNYTGDVRYIYHGNDGTGLPWNDTAQIDFLNPSAREEVMQQIIKVAKNFPIIRFDAAMVLAKKHIRRLWYPEPGHGGDIATRSETRLSTSQFNDAIPNEFWREVVDRIAKEVPDTLLLAEAFWMMEGYFVRTLGMHRVYNSAFMNMLKKEENQKYRETIKNTLLFDRQVLKRFVNFMNNPDEETAVAQFGKGDKYFGVCTLMVTMPGLPMFGHGQIEGFEEKYGMEYAKAYWNESPDEYLLHRHEKDIFPLMKNRYLFAEVENFLFYDLWNNGSVNENVFAYSNEAFGKRTLVLYNNKYERSFGWINQSCEYVVKTEDGENDKTFVSKKVAEGLGLTCKHENFCILFEHLSSLWYIRKSSDIFDNGLFVALNGFEVQVYMDIHEVQDTEEKKWSILCESLQGKGCENLEVAWEEIKYAKLYQSLSSFLGEFLPLIYNLINENYSKKMSKSAFCLQLEKIFEIVKDSAINFYTVGIEEAKNENVKMHSSQKQFLEFKKLAHLILENFYEIDFDVNEKKDCTVYESLLEKSFAKEFIQTYFLQEESSVFAFLCYASLWNFSSTALAEKFSFDRKIFENAKLFLSEEINIKIDFDFKNLLKKIFLFAPMTKKIATKKIKIDTGHDVIGFLLDNKNSSFFCGKNLYDGVKWYKKEMFESSVAIFFMLAILHSSLEVEQQIIKLFRDIADANIRASYKCELLINQFAKQNRSKASSKKGASHIPSIRQSNGKQKEMTMAVTTAKKTTATKKPAAKKATTVKKPAAKKATTAKKPAAKKPVAKKSTTAKKPAVKKATTAKKPAAKKPVAKKTTTAKKPAVKKATTAKKPAAKKATAKK